MAAGTWDSGCKMFTLARDLYNPDKSHHLLREDLKNDPTTVVSFRPLDNVAVGGDGDQEVVLVVLTAVSPSATYFPNC